MSIERTKRQCDRRSLLSVMATAVMITLNHWYRLGPAALVLGAVLLAGPAAFWMWFRRNQSRVALGAYLAMNAWIVVGFGLFKGFWKTILPLVIGRTTPGPAGMEISGVLTLVGSLLVAYTACGLIAETCASKQARLATRAQRRHTSFRVGSATVLAVAISGWVGLEARPERSTSAALTAA